MAEYKYDLKVPKERVAVLIGKNGEVKTELEKNTRTRIEVDSKEGDVFVIGEDPLMLYSVREVIKAIGRGFNPEIAELLLKQDYAFELIPLMDYAKEKNHFVRLKGRVIGADGKSRRTIEQLTETFISVYGKTIGVIGRIDNVFAARKAIESLLSGSLHSSVYRWLEKRRKDMKEKEFLDKDPM